MLTLLYIEDDPDTRMLVQELLAEGQQEPGDAVKIRMLEAEDAEEAFRLYGSAHLDGILLDNRLGAEQGVDLLPRIKQVWKCPVWIFAAFSNKLLADRCMENGAAGLISKDIIMGSGKRLLMFLLEAFGSAQKLKQEVRIP